MTPEIDYFFPVSDWATHPAEEQILLSVAEWLISMGESPLRHLDGSVCRFIYLYDKGTDAHCKSVRVYAKDVGQGLLADVKKISFSSSKLELEKTSFKSEGEVQSFILLLKNSITSSRPKLQVDHAWWMIEYFDSQGRHRRLRRSNVGADFVMKFFISGR